MLGTIISAPTRNSKTLELQVGLFSGLSQERVIPQFVSISGQAYAFALWGYIKSSGQTLEDQSLASLSLSLSLTRMLLLIAIGGC